MNDDALLTIRQPGARLLVLLFWLNVPALYLASWLIGRDNALLIAGLGAFSTELQAVFERITTAMRDAWT